MNRLFHALSCAALALCLQLAPTFNATAQEISPEKRQEIESVIRSYLLENPEIIREAIFELEKKEAAQAETARSETLDSAKDTLVNSKRQVVLGNPDGDVTLVEFFDYNCGYCRRAMGDMARLLEEDKNLRVVLKEFPVLGEASVEAAQVAIAVNAVAPDKYYDFHEKLLTEPGRANKAKALGIVADLGVNNDAIETAMNDAEVNATIEEVYSLANRLGLTGTPSYVVGKNVLIGAVGYDQLKAKIEETRQCGENC